MKDTTMKTHRKNSLIKKIGLGALLALLLAASGAHRFAATSEAATSSPFQQTAVWTAVASTGAVDESSIPLFGTDGASLGFKSANGATIKARYNVTNTYDNNANPNVPGWTHFRLGSTAPAGSAVRAILYQVDCHGERVELCRVTNSGDGTQCDTCELNVPINFQPFWYYVEVEINRNNQMLQPLAHTLRLE